MAASVSRVGLLCFGLMCIVAPARAQHFNGITYTEAHGLPSSSVFSITQDTEGQLWFACRLGLAAFDGFEWSVYGTADGLPSTTWKSIAADRQGGVWAVANRRTIGLFHFKNGVWQRIPKPVFVDPDPDAEVTIHLMEDQGKVTPILVLDYFAVAVFEDDRWRLISTNQFTNGIVTASLLLDNRLILGTLDGLFEMVDDTFKPLYAEQLAGLGTAISGLSLGVNELGVSELYVSGQDWIGVVRNNTIDVLPYKPPPSDYQNYTRIKFLPDDDGVFVANANNLFYYNRRSGKRFPLNSKTGMASDGVMAMFRDREGVVWLGTPRGLIKLPNRRIVNFNKNTGLLEDEVTAVLPLDDGKMMLGHNNGFSIYDNGEITTHPLLETRVDERIINRVMDLESDPLGYVWAALSSNGLLRIDPDLNTKRIPFLGTGGSLQTVCLSHDGETIWAGGSEGIYITKGDILEPMEVSMPNKTWVRQIRKGRQGRLLISTSRDLAGVFDGTLRWYRPKRGLSMGFFTLYEDNDGRIWAGTDQGLARLINGQMALVQDTPGLLLQRPIYFLAPDSKTGGLWAGTDNGIFHLKRDQPTVHLSVSQGLSGLETNRAAGVVDQDEFLWVGTNRGLSLVPLGLKPKPAPAPNLMLRAMDVGGETLDPQTSITLEPEFNDLAFHFQVITGNSHKQVDYETWLEGHEPGFAPYETRDRVIRYSNLPSGEYTFHMRARVGEGVWSEEVRSAQITIRQPLLNETWFRLFAGLILLLLLYTGFDYSVSKSTRRDLEQKVAERTSMLMDKMQEHRSAEARYQALSEELEERVRERTAELEEIQKDLIENAHYAGMAEIATSVLHNVGNILNSISTSGYLVGEAVDKMPLEALERAGDMLRENIDDFPKFLSEDPRGPKLLSYYLTIGDKFKVMDDQIKNNLKQLLDRIDTIKHVVAQQHNYTSNVYQTEDVELQEMVETAIAILREGMNSRGVEIRRDYRPGPKVRIQRTKLIHTLVNVLKNAREAIQLAGDKKRVIEIGLKPSSKGMLLAVTDSGIGITDEEMQRIFEHGFTTKERGNGFGLHSCAIAMNDMGGSIWAESPGKGYGTTFFLHFPEAGKPSIDNSETRFGALV